MRLFILFLCLVFIRSVTAQIPLFPITENNKQGFIDSTGKVIIAPKFITIKSFSEGLAAAREPQGNYGFIDSVGNWKIPPQYDYATYFSEGLAVVFKNGKPFFINHKGEKVFNLPDNTLKITPFKNGVARVEIGKYAYYVNEIGLINKKGEWILKPIYRSSITFKDSLIKVSIYSDKHFKRQYTEWSIDTLGKMVKPKHVIALNYLTVINNNKIEEPIIPYLRLKNDKERMIYVNNDNKIVWQSSINSSKIDTFDIDYISSNSFAAASKADEYDPKDTINKCDSKFYEHPITKDMLLQDNKLSLEIRPTDTVHIDKKWLGYKIFLANNSNYTYYLNTDYDLLDMTMQALNEQGKWQDILKRPFQGCTGFSTMTFIPKQYWQFEMPLFNGNLKTRLRLKLFVNKKRGKGFDLYSNEIPASINPAQFWKRKYYTLRTLMEDDEDDALN